MTSTSFTHDQHCENSFERKIQNVCGMFPTGTSPPPPAEQACGLMWDVGQEATFLLQKVGNMCNSLGKCTSRKIVRW
jgi:hypothetical protein